MADIMVDNVMSGDFSADGDYENAKGKGKRFFKKAWQRFKTVSLGVPLNAYLLLLRLNFKGLATTYKKMLDGQRKKDPIQTKNWEKVTTRFNKLGGNRTHFKKAVEAGAKKKPPLAAIKAKLKRKKSKRADGKDEYITELYIEGLEGDYLNAVATVGGSIAAAMPVIEAMGTVATVGITTKQLFTPKERQMISDSNKNSPYKSAVDEALAQPDQTFFQKYKLPIIIGGIGILGLASYFLYKKFKK